jgi:N-acetylglucosamine-6-sulfatase
LAGCLSEDEPDASRAPAAEAREQPNVVLVMTDDQEAGSIDAMPHLRALIGGEGVTFERFFASYPLCCPSRTTVWTGQFAHNHGVRGNFPDEDGGGYVNLTEPDRVLPEWLRLGGYHTVHIGKWASVPGEIPPRGWNEWYGIAQETSARYYGFELVGTGEPLEFGEAYGDYHTDAVTRTAVEAIERRAERARPLFLSVAYLAPHLGYGRADAATARCNPGGRPVAPVPAPRHAGAFERAPLPMPPSFDEADVSDKAGEQPDPVSARERAELLLLYRCRLAALQAVDEGVADLVEALDQAGELDETYFFFTSDNGFLLGEHRYDARKNLPYDGSARVPLLVRGPGVEALGPTDALAVNVDLAGTILELTGVEPPGELDRPQDGRSLVPLLEGGGAWPERAILIEGRDDTAPVGDAYEVESYRAVRTSRYLLIRKYAEPVDSPEAGAAAGFGGGELVGTELYDLDRDPYELESVAGDPAYAEIEARLGEALDTLSECEGPACELEVRLPDPS